MKRDTLNNRIKFINQNLCMKNGKHPTVKSLKATPESEINKVIENNNALYQKWLQSVSYIALGRKRDGEEYIFENWLAESEEDLRMMAKKSHIEILQVATANDHHFCQYCQRIADTKDDDLLCNECHMSFGHKYFSEL